MASSHGESRSALETQLIERAARDPEFRAHLVANPKAAMTKLCGQLGLSYSDTCLYPSWNGVKLEQVYPWGTIRVPTPEVNVATMNELTDDQKAQIKALSIVMQRALGYENFWSGTARIHAAA